MSVLTLSAAQVRAAVPMAAAVTAVREAFVGLARGEFEMPQRTVLAEGGFLAMSVHHRPTGTAMTKVLSLAAPGGRSPAILGTVVFGDRESEAQLVADASAVTALRTGAVSGVATDLLAPRDASRLTLVGAGGQAADQVRAVQAVRPLTHLTVVARTASSASRLVAELSPELPGVSVVAATDLAAAVAEADLVCCATTATSPIFALEDLRPQVHVNAVGSYRPPMRELPDALLADALVVVDDRDAVLTEAGEVIRAVKAGLVEPSGLLELGTALVERREDRAGAEGRTVFKSVGVAGQDWALARLLSQQSGAPRTGAPGPAR